MNRYKFISEKPETKPFKVLDPPIYDDLDWPRFIRWDALDDELAKKDHANQSLGDLNFRGGLSPEEIYANINKTGINYKSISQMLRSGHYYRYHIQEKDVPEPNQSEIDYRDNIYKLLKSIEYKGWYFIKM